MSTTTNLGITKLDAGLRQPEIVINNAFDAFDAAIGGAWTSFTPTFTNLSVGNGTRTAKYVKISKTVVCRVHIVFGSTTSISGSVTFSLPQTSAAHAGVASIFAIGLARFFDTSAPASFEGRITLDSTTTALIAVMNAAATYAKDEVLSSTVPFTWATGDELSAYFIYEAA